MVIARHESNGSDLYDIGSCSQSFHLACQLASQKAVERQKKIHTFAQRGMACRLFALEQLKPLNLPKLGL